MNFTGKFSCDCGKSVFRHIRRRYSDKSLVDKLNRQRNIGILAHVDAGKTTTTERMLFYSGEITSKGEVHHGNTVTDFMVQERERGISIASAFVQLNWKQRTLNLVDTPGHIDFTAEVENALGVIDSAVLLLDASAGVEAQTLTVWKQIQYHGLPCLIYINKMDRSDADVDFCLTSLKSKLHCVPLLVQIPVFGGRNAFVGVIDLPSMNRFDWDVSRTPGQFKKYVIKEGDSYYEKAADKRNELVDQLSTYDDELANAVLEKGTLEAIEESEIIRSIQKVTISQQAVPVVCGSSYKDIGVQPLLNAIIDFLPSPVQNNLPATMFNPGDQYMKSFKVTHDKHRGPITFVRIYSGKIAKSQRVYNASKEDTETIGKILIPFADDFEEVAEATTGQFVALTGLKTTHSGEILVNSASALKRIKNHIRSLSSHLDDEQVDKLLMLEKKIIPPVFFRSVEPPSHAFQLALEKALVELQREDSSLGVMYDEETGQTVLSGMGELHLDIIRDRLRSNYKLDVDVGDVQIMYKEQLVSAGSSSYHLVNTIGSHQHEVFIKLSLKSTESSKLLILDKSQEAATNLAHVTPKQLAAIERGIKMALRRGPALGYEVINAQSILHWLEAKRHVPEQLLSAAASHCINNILANTQCNVLEPIMSVDVSVPKDKCHLVIGDLGRRRGDILRVEEKGEYKMVQSLVPTSELVGYSTDLRTITSGMATLLITFAEHRTMSDAQVTELKNFAFSYKRIR